MGGDDPGRKAGSEIQALAGGGEREVRQPGSEGELPGAGEAADQGDQDGGTGPGAVQPGAGSVPGLLPGREPEGTHV